MSKPANKKVIGLFVVCAIALAVVAILVLGSGKLFKRTVSAVCYFEGSVGGLNVGAPVVIRGVKVGSVTDIVLDIDPKKMTVVIPVHIEIGQTSEAQTLHFAERRERYKRWIQAGLRAQLEMQSIVTGQLQIGLDLHPDKPAKFVSTDPNVLEIPTIRTALQELTEKVEKIPIDEIFQKVLSAVEGIEKVVKSPEIGATLRSINRASDEAKNLITDVNRQVGPLGASLQETVKEYGKVAQNVNTQIDPVVSDLKETVSEVKKLVQNVDRQVGQVGPDLKETIGDIRKLVKDADERVGQLTTSASGVFQEYGKLANEVNSRIPGIASGIEKTLGEIQTTLLQARESLAVVADTLNENSTLYVDLADAMEEISAGARSIRFLADFLKRHPDSVLWGK